MISMTMQRIAVLGAGTMGRGIAQVAALAGIDVALVDVDQAILESAREAIDASVAKGIERGKTPADGADRIARHLRLETEMAKALGDVQCVIEAVPESFDLKVEVLTEVAQRVSAECVLGTNTSSLPITGIAAKIPGPERVIGLHFFNPVPIMGLVEIVRGLATSDRVEEESIAFARAIGKEPIVVKDSPGFATSRLGVAIGLEAIRMLESGVAAARDIDRAMELGYRHPMGPLRLTDLVGLDVRLAIAEHLHRELGEQLRPPALLRKLVRAGHLGKKSGRGFYDWSETS